MEWLYFTVINNADEAAKIHGEFISIMKWLHGAYKLKMLSTQLCSLIRSVSYVVAFPMLGWFTFSLDLNYNYEVKTASRYHDQFIFCLLIHM